MTIQLNGKPFQWEGGSLAALVQHLAIAKERVALVRNEIVVRRADWEQTPVAEGDIIELITMVGGG